MLTLSKKCAEILVRHGKISDAQINLYKYGFELLFSTAITLGFILLLSVFGGYVSQIIIFLLYFIPIRIAAGGYHAKSYGRCYYNQKTYYNPSPVLQALHMYPHHF